MVICNHIIKDEEVIGIGPLMIQSANDQIAVLYNTKKLYFELHLKNHTTKIESGWFELGYNGAPDNKAVNAYNEFKKSYEQAKTAVIELIQN